MTMLTLTRLKRTGEAVAGVLNGPGGTNCETLEHESVKIAAGTYALDIRHSERFHRPLIHIEPVPGRSELMIHPLNYFYESRGCIGVGRGWMHVVGVIEPMLLHSGVTERDLQERVSEWLARGPVSLTILNEGIAHGENLSV